MGYDYSRTVDSTGNGTRTKSKSNGELAAEIVKLRKEIKILKKKIK